VYKDFKDYYSLLEVDFNASEADIKAAYRKMARVHHPDMHSDAAEEHTRIFQEITEAYETLSDPQRKMTYDFRYRQLVLGEGPQYEYYVDETPEDTRKYEHKYTSRSKRAFSIVPIGMVIVLVLQLLRLVLQAAPVGSPKDELTRTSPQDLQELLHRVEARSPRDTDYVYPVGGSSQ
jgi:curved DNA-binding protein CbpA